MQIHISHTEYAPITHILNNPVVEINSQHPHLLGFDSNLIPNSSISTISAISGRRFRIFGRIGEIHLYLSVSSWENPE